MAHTTDSLKVILAQAGFKNVYAHRTGYLIVKESDTVKVQINISPRGAASVHSKFPQIGSSVQVISTLLFIIVGFSGFLPYPLISAVLLGQLLSVLWFQPKINTLKKEVENLLS
jgi:hypothetical protein